MGRHKRTGKGKKNTKNAATKPLHITESTNKAYAYIAALISLSISSTRQLLVGLIELELIGVGVGVELEVGSGVSGVFVGLCRLTHPHFMYFLYTFNLIQFISLPLSSRKKSRRGYWTREPANLALPTPSGPPFTLTVLQLTVFRPFSPLFMYV